MANNSFNEEFYKLVENLIGENVYPTTVQSKQYKGYYVANYPGGVIEITTKNPIQADNDIYVVSPQALLDPLERQDILVGSYNVDTNEIELPRTIQHHAQQKSNLINTVIIYVSVIDFMDRHVMQKHNLLRVNYSRAGVERKIFMNFLNHLIFEKTNKIALFNNRFYVEYDLEHQKLSIYDQDKLSTHDLLNEVDAPFIYSYASQQPIGKRETIEKHLVNPEEDTELVTVVNAVRSFMKNEM